GDYGLRGPVVVRRPPRVGQSADAKPIDHVLIAVFLQAEEAEPGVTDARFVHQTRAEDVRPDQGEVLAALQLVAAETRRVARRAERSGNRVEFGRVGELVNAEEVVLLAELVVQARRKLVDIEFASPGRNEVVRRPRPVRIREERQQPSPLLAPERLRDLVAWEGLVVVERIANRRADGAEVASLKGRQRHGRQPRLLLPAPLTFVPHEEECPVAPERAAQHAAELVTAEARLTWRKEV